MSAPVDELGLPPLARRVFCNRTLNMRSIDAVGCDMDYTLVHYNTEAWERRAYDHAKGQLLKQKWPVGELEFDPALASLGLVIDVELGNVVKANRFGHVRKACHGTRMLSREEQREIYPFAPMELSESRWEFMNTLFSLSEACLFMQLVELLDAGKIPGVMGYRELYGQVRDALDATHLEGELKSEIMANPEAFVVLDEELPLALLDLKHAGKKLLLITNSEWPYTKAMMHYAFDRFLPEGQDWRSLFDLIVVQARKPSFFSGNAPAFELVDDDGLLRPWVGKLRLGHAYLGGNARLVEDSLGIRGDDILYIGDHIFADVLVSKDLLRWRTALVVRELEEELGQLSEFNEKQAQLHDWMRTKALLEHQFSQLRLTLQRRKEQYAEYAEDGAPLSGASAQDGEVKARIQSLRAKLVKLDEQIAPLAREANQLVSSRWGQLMRCGNDKSHLARQIERYADLYMSRVSNLLAYTPYVYLRAPRGTLPHDSAIGTEWE